MRILPLTIIIAVLMFGVKVVDLVRGTESLLINKVEAETPSEAEKKKMPEASKIDETQKKEEEKKPKAEVKEGDKKEEKKDNAKDAKPEEKAKKEESKETPKEGEAEGEKKDKPNPNVSETPVESQERRFNSVELELLQNLSKRREELDKWESNVQIKEAALNATEQRIDEKIKQIEAMKQEVGVLLAQYNEKEDAKIKSLVKIYENMKPKDAARIFDEIEMPILLLVIDKMAEKKAAPILAGMDAKKAKQLTVELAEQRKVRGNRLNANASPVPKPPTP